MKGRFLGVLAGAALIASASLASAAVPATDVKLDTEQVEPLGVQAQGGIAGYTGDLGNVTGTGISWGVMATGEPSEIFGVEVGYLGSRIPFDDARVGGAMVQNGVQGLAKVYAPLEFPVKPFLGAGLGVTYANPTGAAESLYGNDLIAELPLAAGVEYRAGNILAGARAAYTPLYGESFANEALPGNGQGSVLEGRLTVGGRF